MSQVQSRVTSAFNARQRDEANKLAAEVAGRVRSGESADAVAAELGVNMLRLRRLLERAGTSVMAIARERRPPKGEPSQVAHARSWGLGVDEYRTLVSKGITRAYKAQRSHAIRRGIEWLFTKPEWLNVWQDSGKIDERGIGASKYVMARRGDTGPYAAWNVEIITHSQNSRDCRKNHPDSYVVGNTALLGRGRGWTRVGRAYQVTVGKRYVGTYRTEGEARAAYLRAVEEVFVQRAHVDSGHQACATGVCLTVGGQSEGRKAPSDGFRNAGVTLPGVAK